MYLALATLLDRLDSPELSDSPVIHWGAPVPAFGDPFKSQIATLGLNPSNREFVDDSGEELDGASRRFHTLRSLNLGSWSQASTRHFSPILASCRDYFRQNPYDRWFGKLENVIEGAAASFYGERDRQACHLDLIPYATERKWTKLRRPDKETLLEQTGDALGLLLSKSSIEILVLNGRSVVGNFEELADVELKEKEMPGWSLPRRNGRDVPGIAFSGRATYVGGVHLGGDILVLGYNHNIQSSFGVTNEVVDRICSWVSEKTARL